MTLAEIKLLYSIAIEFGQPPICPLCGRPITNIHNFSFDHIIPKSQGGKRSLENMQPTHKKCNQNRSDRELMRKDAKVGDAIQTQIEYTDRFGGHFHIEITYGLGTNADETDKAIARYNQMYNKHRNRNLHKNHQKRGGR